MFQQFQSCHPRHFNIGNNQIYLFLLQKASASIPFAAVPATRKPSFSQSTKSFNPCKINGSSSTNNTFSICFTLLQTGNPYRNRGSHSFFSFYTEFHSVFRYHFNLTQALIIPTLPPPLSISMLALHMLFCSSVSLASAIPLPVSSISISSPSS